MWIRDIPLPPERHPNANRLKASEIEEKIGVNIKFNIDPDFLFDLRELLIRFSLVPFRWKGYIPVPVEWHPKGTDSKLLQSNKKSGSILRELQNSIRSQICAFSVGFDFLQSAYGQEDMSLCKKSNQRKNHQILLAKRVLQFPQY